MSGPHGRTVAAVVVAAGLLAGCGRSDRLAEDDVIDQLDEGGLQDELDAEDGADADEAPDA